MFHSVPDSALSLFQRYRSGQRGRIVGLILTLLIEGGLVLVLLSLGSSITQQERPNSAITVVDVKPAAAQSRAPTPKAEETPALARARSSPSQTAEPKHPAPSPIAAEPAQPARQVIQLSPSQMAAADITALPRRAEAAVAPARSPMGPPDTGPAVRDTARVGGSGPNGEPLYAAAWYREPYEDELSGYLSTATGPGWGMIACRTAPDYRVEDCVKVDEYPTGSNIARAVLAAAWQFRVRPPRLGGQARIGEWVRIRIDYGIRRK